MSSYTTPKPWTYRFDVDDVRNAMYNGIIFFGEEKGVIICHVSTLAFVFCPPDGEDYTLAEFMDKYTIDEQAEYLAEVFNAWKELEFTPEQVDYIAKFVIPRDRLITIKTREDLEKIVMSNDSYFSARGGIHVIGNDEEDNPEINIVRLQNMLEQAYLYGVQSAGGSV